MEVTKIKMLLDQLKDCEIQNLQSLRSEIVSAFKEHLEEYEVQQKTLELAYHEMREMLDLFNKKDLLSKSIFNASQDIILTLDSLGQLIEFNQAFSSILKIEGKDVMGKRLYEVLPDCEFVQDLTAWFSAPGKEQQGATDKVYETTLKTADHKDLIVLVSIKKILLRESVIFALYIKDLTYEKDAAREIEEGRSQLMLTSKMSALGEMAGGVAHEINTPLAIIQMRTDQLLECVEDQSLDPEFLKSALGAIDSTVKRIAKIVSGLRSFARDGRKDPVVATSFAKIIDDTFSLCKEKFSSHGVHLEYVAAQDFEVDCRPSEIAQVLLNLLNNSYDAIQEKPEKWVRVEMREDAEMICVRVMDSGDGIPEDIQKKIMQPFFTTKEVGKGTGLGLSISRGIIESHGGKLILDSSSKNTCFLVLLPKKAETAQVVNPNT